MMAAPLSQWLLQLNATVRRNILIKLRDGSQTLQEIFLPVYIIMLLILVKLVQPDVSLPAVPAQPAVDAACMLLDDPHSSPCWTRMDLATSEAEASIPKVLGFAPSSPLLLPIMQHATEEVKNNYPDIAPLSVTAFASEDELVNFYKQHPEVLYAGVVFQHFPPEASSLPPILSVAIRMNGSALPPSSLRISSKFECRPPELSQQFAADCPSQKYLTSGFLAIQTSLSHAIAAAAWHSAAAAAAADPGVAFAPTCPSLPSAQGDASQQPLQMTAVAMPLPPLHRSFSSTRFQLFTAMYLVWALIPLLQVALSQIVTEKETMLKDCLLLMGLLESVYWLSWLITYAIIAAVTSTVIVVAAKWSTLFAFSQMAAILLVIFPACLSFIALAFALSTLFSEEQTATAVAAFLLLVASALIIPIDLLHFSTAACCLLLLCSPVGMAMAVNFISKSEGSLQGLSLSNFWSPYLGVDPGDDPNPVSVGLIVLFFIFDTLLYLLLAWYLDNVWPHPDRGPKRPPLFIFSRSFWFPQHSSAAYLQLGALGLEDEIEEGEEGTEMAGLVGGGGDEEGGDREGSERVSSVLSAESERHSEPPAALLPSSAALHLSDQEQQVAAAAAAAAAAEANERMTAGTEEPVTGLRASLVLRGIWKVYSRQQAEGGLLGSILRALRKALGRGKWTAGMMGEAEVAAVRGVSLTLYEGQTFALLGHSGCGKSSLLNVISGLSMATTGEAFLEGFSLSRGESQLRSTVGVCPQHSIGLRFLTVREQLLYFAAIKGSVDRFHLSPIQQQAEAAAAGGGGRGGKQQQQKEEVTAVMEELGLTEVQHVPAYCLSSSLQRKLAIAIALIGDPKLVLLDEPTKDLDATSRKQVWDALSRRRRGRVILLATDSMEEADAAAERKAVMSQGGIRCCGSSLFLKSHFGLAFTLHVTKAANFDPSALLALINSHLQQQQQLVAAEGSEWQTREVEVVERSELHVTYLVPVTGTQGDISSIIIDIARKAGELGVADAALEATTLEEAFLRFKDEADDDLLLAASPPLTSHSHSKAAHPVPTWPAAAAAAASAATSSSSMAGSLPSGSEDSQLLLQQQLSSSSSPPSAAAAAAAAAACPSPPSSAPPAAISSPSSAASSLLPPWATIQRQTQQLLSLKALSYWRQWARLINLCLLPLVFTAAAFIIQAAFQRPSSSPPVPLYDSNLATATPLFYSTRLPQQQEDARKVVSLLGPNHSFLNATQLQQHFLSDPTATGLPLDFSNAVTNGRGSRAVGVVFEELDLQACLCKYQLLHQPWHVHQLPTLAAMIDNALLLAINEQHAAAAVQSMAMASHPLHFESYPFVLSFFTSAVVAIGLLMMPPIFSAQMVAEMHNGQQQLLRLHCLHGFAFWLSSLLVDAALFFLLATAITLIGLIFDHPPFTLESFPLLLAFNCVISPALTLFSYLFSFFFLSPHLAASFLSLLFLLFAVVPYIFILSLPATSYLLPHFLLCLFCPPYSLLSAYHFAASFFSHPSAGLLADASGPTITFFLVHSSLSPFFTALFASLLSLPLLLLLLLALEGRKQSRAGQQEGDLSSMAGPEGGESEGGEGDDMERERIRVQEAAAAWDRAGVEGDDDLDPILCSSLGKNIGASSGVCGVGRSTGRWVLRDIWLAAKRGEVIVVVGGEKSGKSSFLRCLAAAMPPSYGDALVAGSSIRFSPWLAPHLLTLCPQGEIVFPHLTVGEHLRLIASLRGLPLLLDETLHQLNLSHEINSRADSLSSASLRRLCLSMALLPSLPLLLLDEPTRGLDMKSRRDVWQMLLSCCPPLTAIVTTQSVEEAEAIGSRVAFLVDGRIACLDHPLSLKRRFGSLYTLLVSAPVAGLAAIEQQLTAQFSGGESSSDQSEFTSIQLHSPGGPIVAPLSPTRTASDIPSPSSLSIRVEEGLVTPTRERLDSGAEPTGQVRMSVPVADLESLARLMGELKKMKDNSDISDFSVTQPSLQQIFHRISHNKN